MLDMSFIYGVQVLSLNIFCANRTEVIQSVIRFLKSPIAIMQT